VQIDPAVVFVLFSVESHLLSPVPEDGFWFHFVLYILPGGANPGGGMNEYQGVAPDRRRDVDPWRAARW
jgi:hypothetical protein